MIFFGSIVVRQGKGGQPRTVPLTAPVRTAIRDYLDNLQWSGANLWVGQRGPLKDPSAINKMLEKYALQANVDPQIVSPHVLRHTFSTRYLAQNPNDLRGLAAILGHASLDTVMIYTEPTTADLARRMEQL